MIGVGIPTYNHGKYLLSAVDSLLAQSYQDWLAIILDDCSTDNTSAVFEAIDDPRITKLSLKENHGISYAKNECLMRMSADYYMFLDADNFLAPECLEKLVAADADIAYGDYKRFGARNDLVTLREFSKEDLKRYCCIPPFALIKFMTVAHTGWFNEHLEAFEDYEYWVRAVKKGAKPIYVPGLMYYHRFYPSNNMDSITNRVNTVYGKHQAIHNDIRNLHPEFFK